MNPVKLKSDYIFPWLAIIACFCLGLFFLYASINKPLQADSIPFAKYVQEPGHERLYLWHPPLYQNTLRFFSRVFNWHNQALSWYGVGCFFLTLVLIYFIGKETARKTNLPDNLGLLAVFLYCLHPLAIQGSLILDIDNTLLTVLLTLFVLYFCNTYEKLRLRNSLAWAGLFFILLWTKLSTPLVLIPVVFLFLTPQTGWKRSLGYTFLFAVVGIGLFLAVWSIYARGHHLPYSGVFQRVGLHCWLFRQEAIASQLPELIKRVSRLCLWLNPFLLLLGLMAFITRLKGYRGKPEIIDFLFLYTIAILLAYIIVGGLGFGFPKYHFPLLAVFSVILAHYFYSLGLKFRPGEIAVALVLAGLYIIYNINFVGDLFYIINHTLKMAMIFNPQNVNGLLKTILFKGVLSLLPLLVALIALSCYRKYRLKQNLAISLFIAAITVNLSLDLMQARAPYCTNYCYGRDIAQMKTLGLVFQQIRNRIGPGIFIGPEDTLVGMGILPYQAIRNSLKDYQYQVIGEDREKFIQAISDQQVICVVLDPSWNTVAAYRNIFFNNSVESILKGNYEYQQVGLASLWVRKLKAGRAN